MIQLTSLPMSRRQNLNAHVYNSKVLSQMDGIRPLAGIDRRPIPDFPATLRRLHELTEAQVTPMLRRLGYTDADMVEMTEAAKRDLLKAEAGIVGNMVEGR